MQNEIQIYYAKKSNMLGGVFVLALMFFGFALPAIIVGELPPQRELIGQAIGNFLDFWIVLNLCPSCWQV